MRSSLLWRIQVDQAGQMQAHDDQDHPQENLPGRAYVAEEPAPSADSSERGQIVGWSDRADGGAHAFSWTQAGGMIDLGTFDHLARPCQELPRRQSAPEQV